MLGGGVYAYTLLGVEYCKESDEARYLILDPHYVGTDTVKNVIDKGGVAWKKKGDIFLDNVFYNFCLP